MPFYVKVKGSFPGKHYWPEAPERFQELGKLHEHVFHFVVEIRVVYPREIEFLEVAQQITQRLSRHLQDHPDLSCEEMARDLFDDFAEGWAAPVGAGRVIYTEVNEDGGCGAIYRLSRGEELHYSHVLHVEVPTAPFDPPKTSDGGGD